MGFYSPKKNMSVAQEVAAQYCLNWVRYISDTLG
jgi:hypothetical protein